MNNVMSFLKKIADYIKNLDKKKRNIYIVILGISVVLTLLSVIILNHKDYVVLYRNLDTKEAADIVKRLDELKIANKVENGNTIYVEKSEEPKVKLQLASEGYPKSTLNYDIFTQNINLMTTDYEKAKYNLFMLQERLQGSIKTLDSVKNAIVTISLPDNSMAVLDKDKVPASASVVLTLVNGVTLSEQQIKGIVQLVARSVPGLTAANVSIIDQTGRILNDSSSDNSTISAADRVKSENDISNMLSNRIKSVLEPIYGKGNISIGLNVVLDYNRKTTETTQYSQPNGNTGLVGNYHQTFEGAGAAPSPTGVPGTTTVPGQTQTGTTGNNQDIRNDVSVQYFVNQVKEQVQKDGAEIKDVTVSVLINKKDMTTDESDRVTKIVANTTGIAKEKVELLSTEFATSGNKIPTDNATPVKQSILSLLTGKYLIIAAIGLALLLILIAVFILLKRKRNKRELLEEIVTGEELSPAPVKDIMAEYAKISESKEQQLTREIREFSIKTPQITAQLIRTLLKGDID